MPKKVSSKKVSSKKVPKPQSSVVDITTLTVPTKKQIFLRNRGELGDKIFDLIYGIYLFKKYKGKCIITYVDYEYPHATSYAKGLPESKILFPKAIAKLNYMTPEQYETLQPILGVYAKVEVCFHTLAHIPTYTELGYFTRICKRYQYTYDMFKTFTSKDRALFDLDTSLINNKSIIKLTSQKYAVVFVSYGQHLSQSLSVNTGYDIFLTSTPQFYIDMIEMLLIKEKNLQIFVCTDTLPVVKKFIMPFVAEHKSVKLIDLKPVDAYYLMLHASYIIMSSYSICYSAAYLNKKKPECHLALYRTPTSQNIHTHPNEYALMPGWIVHSKEKYILNYDRPLVEKMYNYCRTQPGGLCVFD